MRKTSLEDVLIVSLARGARGVVRRLSSASALRLGRAFGRLAWTLSKRRRIAVRNLRSVFADQMTDAELSRIALRSFENLGMNMIELLRFPELDARYLHENVTVRGREHFESSLRKGKGVLMLTAHFGNWELLNTVSSLFGYKMVALARKQKHPRADAFLNGLRETKGNKIVYKGYGVREILRTLKDGGIVGILSDQDGGRAGVFVRFFDRLSSTPAGVATFALRTGAPIHPVFSFREGHDRHRIEICAALDPAPPLADEVEAERHLLKQFSDRLESAVRRAPDQWLWAHRRWKSTPDRAVIVLHDGRAGHLSQSMGLVEELRRSRRAEWPAEETVHERVIEIRFKSQARRAVCSAAARAFRGYVPLRGGLLRWALDTRSWEALDRAHADIVISTGSSSALCNIHLARRTLARSVVIMDPGLPCGHFAAMIVPYHDKIRLGKNVYRTVAALSALSASEVVRAGEELRRHHGLARRPVVGLLIGGDVRGGQGLDRNGLVKALDALGQHLRATGSAVLITTSRRTPDWVSEILKSRFLNKEHCPVLVIVAESNPPGTIASILGASDVVITTAESVSMISEAVRAAKPVLALHPSDSIQPRPKHRRFLQTLGSRYPLIESGPSGLGQALLILARRSTEPVPDPDRSDLAAAVRVIL